MQIHAKNIIFAMNAKDLWVSCNFENESSLVIQKILYIPKRFDKCEIQCSLNLKEIFLNDNTISIEYCSGNGQWIIEKAKENPNINWISVEKKVDRARKIWNKMRRLQLDNLLVVIAEAEMFTKVYLKENQISSVFINFPDPWPKRKHAKYRLIKEDFLLDLTRVLTCKGNVTLVTDDVQYRNQMIQMFQKVSDFKPLYPCPFYQTKLEQYGTSFFETLWRSKGKDIFYLKYKYE